VGELQPILYTYKKNFKNIYYNFVFDSAAKLGPRIWGPFIVLTLRRHNKDCFIYLFVNCLGSRIDNMHLRPVFLKGDSPILVRFKYLIKWLGVRFNAGLGLGQQCERRTQVLTLQLNQNYYYREISLQYFLKVFFIIT